MSQLTPRGASVLSDNAPHVMRTCGAFFFRLPLSLSLSLSLYSFSLQKPAIDNSVCHQSVIWRVIVARPPALENICDADRQRPFFFSFAKDVTRHFLSARARAILHKNPSEERPEVAERARSSARVKREHMARSI